MVMIRNKSDYYDGHSARDDDNYSVFIRSASRTFIYFDLHTILKVIEMFCYSREKGSTTIILL